MSNLSPSSVPPFSKPRVTTDDQRAKKREMDRICQQRKRKRDRENLHRLQENVQLLQQDKEDALLARLMVENDYHEERIIRHRTRLLQIKGLIEADLADLGFRGGRKNNEDSTEALANPQKATLAPAIKPFVPDVARRECQDAQMVSPWGRETDFLDALFSELPFPEAGPYGPYLPQQPLDAVSAPFESSPAAVTPIQASHGNRCNTWKEVEQIISQIKICSPTSDLDDAELDMHIIITAVSQSWDQFSQAVLVDARWNCLRQLDEKYFAPNYGSVEHLAVLAVASQALKVDMLNYGTKLSCSKILPPFINPRPSQLAFPHSKIADCYVWPGLRERLSVCHNYYTDTFLNATHTMFRFLWPYDFKDAFSMNLLTGLRHLSPRFIANMQDFRCWAMTSDFFQSYPDFQGDVPVSNPLPTQLDFHSLWYDFHAQEDLNKSQED